MTTIKVHLLKTEDFLSNHITKPLIRGNDSSSLYRDVRADERLIARPDLHQELTRLDDPCLLGSPNSELLGENWDGDRL